MKCPICQSVNPDAAAFCNACGGALRATGSMVTTAGTGASGANLRQDAMETAGGAVRPPQMPMDANATADFPRNAASSANQPNDANQTMDAPIEGSVVDPGATLDAPIAATRPTKRKVPNLDAMDTVDSAVFRHAAKGGDQDIKIVSVKPLSTPSFSMSATGVIIPDFGPRYQVDKLLGQGGMGAVYKARDLELDRDVALKLLRPDVIPDQNAISRFKQELLLASRVSHKNILRIHDLGDSNGLKFISMAYIEGEDLHGLIAREGKLPIPRALHIARQLVAALEAAHAESVIHRDLKPQNVLLAQGDVVFVSDFGLAKSTGTENVAQTMSGQFVGTPQYMSPEQVEGRPTDHRGDIYAFGLILYEMLTGQVTFTGSSVFQIMYQRVQGRAPNPKIIRPDTPDYLVRIIDRCLECDPELRYQSAKDIQHDIEAETAPEGSGTFSRRAKRWWYDTRHSSRAQVVAIALAVAIVVTMAIPASRNAVLNQLRKALGTGEVKPSQYVALLPLKVVSDDAKVKLAADGVVDTLAARLFQLKSVQTETTASLTKFNPEDPPQKTGKDLGANIVVSGMVQAQGEQLRVVVNLNDVASGKLLQSFEEKGLLGDLLTIQDNVNKKVVAALRVTSAEQATAALHPTENVEAYQIYLKGRSLMRGQLDQKKVEEALAQFDDAVKRDPNFALAYTGLADASMRMYKETKDAKWADRALSAGQQAATLNDQLPEVHVALGSIYSQTGKQEGAVAELQRAVALAPNNDEGYRRLGDAYLAAGKKTETLAAYTKAIELNQYYWFNYNVLGTGSLKLGEYDAALKAFQKVTQIDPKNAAAYRNIGAVYFRQGKFAEAVPVLQQSLDIEKHRTGYVNLGAALFFLKRYDESVTQFQHAVEIAPNYELAVGGLADAYRWSNKPKEAGDTYNRAIALAQQQLQTNPKDFAEMGRLATYYAKKGDALRATQYIRQGRSVNATDNQLMYLEGQVKAILGDDEGAVAALKLAFENKYPKQEAQNDPELAKLQQRADYKQLMK